MATTRLPLTWPTLLSAALILAGPVLPRPVWAQSAATAGPASAAETSRVPAPVPTTRPVTAASIDAAAVRAVAGMDRLLPSSAERVYAALSKLYRPAAAMELVTFMDRYWRIAGNTGFDASLQRIEAGLREAGFGSTPAASAPRRGNLAYEEYANGGNGWELVKAEMTVVDAATGTTPERVFDPVTDYIALCLNSFSTPPGGVTAPLVYVGSGHDAASYASVDVKGAVVLGDANVRVLWREAVRGRGALGVVSAEPPDAYTRPDETPEVFQWGGVPYDERAKAFGFNASRLVADRLKARLKAGAVRVKVEIETTFKPGARGRLLAAEIPGRLRPDERVVLVAHVQEPGANDDASGCGTLLELARALQAGIVSKAIPVPARTITFIWGDEMRASREWLRADPARAKGVRFMISLDMTGEDATKTGGTFLIEKEPDPSAVWPRPSDPHTEWWGGRDVYPRERLRGSLLNDVYLAACLRRARATGWNVQTNPYEGGSDHSIFLASGVPAALATHFTDRYYHTNLDRPDKTSPAEMANVGIATGVVAALLASSGQEEALAVTNIVARAAEARFAIERRQSSKFIAAAADPAAVAAGERVLLEAWKSWYIQALESVLTLPAEPAGPQLRARVARATATVRKTGVDALSSPALTIRGGSQTR